jgi:hypothetical protein
MLDLVKPAGAARGRSAGDGRQGSMKPGGGRRVRNNIRTRYRAGFRKSNRLRLAGHQHDDRGPFAATFQIHLATTADVDQAGEISTLRRCAAAGSSAVTRGTRSKQTRASRDMVLLMNIPVGGGSAKWLYRDILPIIGDSEIRKSPVGGGRQMGRHRFC